MKNLILGTMLVAAVSSFATGAVSGGGGEYLTTENNPWFIGDSPVRYCLEVDPNAFSSGEGEIRSVLDQVLARWAVAIHSLQPVPTPTNVLDGHAKNLTTAFVREACQPTTELRFVFGVHNKEVDELLKHYARYTIGFAKQLDFDEASGRARGVVWLAGDRGPNAYMGPHLPGAFWSVGTALYNVLLHEMGHVFGLGHSHTGAMAANAPDWAVEGESRLKNSIQDKTMQQWLRTGAPVCGWLLPSDEKYKERLFGIPHDKAARACLITDGTAAYRLAIKTVKDEPVGEWVLQSTGRWVHYNPVLNRIIGYYRSTGAGQLGPRKYHDFVPAKSDDVLMKASIGGQSLQLIVQTSDDRVRIIVNGDGTNPPQYFDIEFPIAEGRSKK